MEMGKILLLCTEGMKVDFLHIKKYGRTFLNKTLKESNLRGPSMRTWGRLFCIHGGNLSTYSLFSLGNYHVQACLVFRPPETNLPLNV